MFPYGRGGNLFYFYTLIRFELNYIAISLFKYPNVISNSDQLVVYLLPTAISSVTGNNRSFDGFVLPVEKEL